MKSHILLVPAAWMLLSLGAAAAAESAKPAIGLQVYSLRDALKSDVPGTLDKIKDLGIVEIELAGVGGLMNPESKPLLEARGFKVISGHWPFERLEKEPEKVAAEAKGFGCSYVACAWVPHDGAIFTEADARKGIAVFNKAGEELAKHGIKFFYHTHGFEFQPYGSDTLFDLLMAETKPENVSYEMDVFWVVHGGQDPEKLFNKYGDRFALVHLKDMKIGTPVNLLTGGTDVKNDVALGTGLIDYRRTLSAAKKAGVKWYFIEDESPTSAQQIPVSLKYLEQVKF